MSLDFIVSLNSIRKETGVCIYLHNLRISEKFQLKTKILKNDIQLIISDHFDVCQHQSKCLLTTGVIYDIQREGTLFS